MIEAQNAKYVQTILPQTITNATVNGIAVDTKGFHYAEAVFFVGSTTGNIDTLKVQESDNGVAFTDVSGASFSGSDLPGATDDGEILLGFLNLGGNRQRYLRIVATEDNTGSGVYSGIIRLTLADQSPNTAAERGAAAQFITT